MLSFPFHDLVASTVLASGSTVQRLAMTVRCFPGQPGRKELMLSFPFHDLVASTVLASGSTVQRLAMTVRCFPGQPDRKELIS